MGVAATALRERRLDTVSLMNMCNPYPLPYVRHGELSCAGVRAAVGLGVRGSFPRRSLGHEKSISTGRRTLIKTSRSSNRIP
jgi:hypothetical protein